MSKGKRLVKDIFLFAIASFGPKMISFFLVPLYTSYLSTEAYGTADLLNTIYTLLLPILTLDVSDAVMIYTIENRDDLKLGDMPIQIASRILVISSALLFCCLAFACVILDQQKMLIYCGYVFLQYVGHAFYNNYLAYLRGRDRVNIIVTSSIISSVSITLLNVLIILVFKWGVYGLFLSNVLGIWASNTYIIIRVGKKSQFYPTRGEDYKELQKKMLRYSIPLIFTGIAWWVNGSSDRLFISTLAGVSLNGIYAVANKIPSILSACHGVIYQALQLSVFSEVNSSNDKTYLQKLYNLYNSAMVIVASILIVMDIPLAKLLFKKDFYIAWHYVPALLISTVLFSVSGYVTTIAAATKNTKLIAKATISGAVINTILNIMLIPGMQIYGAVIATIVGYFFIWYFILRGTIKETSVKLDMFRSIVLYIILLAQWCALLFSNYHYIINMILFALILFINRMEIKEVVTLMMGMVKTKTRKTLQ